MYSIEILYVGAVSMFSPPLSLSKYDLIAHSKYVGAYLPSLVTGHRKAA